MPHYLTKQFHPIKKSLFQLHNKVSTLENLFVTKNNDRIM